MTDKTLSFFQDSERIGVIEREREIEKIKIKRERHTERGLLKLTSYIPIISIKPITVKILRLLKRMKEKV